jgi:phosphoglycerate dehydrogenase-like enzyme
MRTLVVDMLGRMERAGLAVDPVLELHHVELQPLAALAPHLAEAEALLTTPRLDVNDALMDAAPRLRFVQVASTGYERVDLEATARRGIPVAHGAGHNALSVAEHVFMAAMALQRQLVASHLGLVRGEYTPTKNRLMAAGTYELAGKTLGIVGFGRIGRQVARRAIPFEMDTLYYDIIRPEPAEEDEYQVTFVSLPELLRRADILTVHVPLEPSTHHLIGAAELAQLRPTALVIHTARGPIMDTAALAAMVADGRLAGAAVDVFEVEPAPPEDPLMRLAASGCERVLLTPHMAGVTAESAVRGLERALDNLVRVANGQRPRFVVNGVTSPARDELTRS